MSERPKESGPQAGASYLSYLVRMWSMPGEGKAEKWLASVESPLTREQHHFADLETLFAFLRAMTGQPAPVDAESRNTHSREPAG